MSVGVVTAVLLSATGLGWAAAGNPWPEFEKPVDGPPRAIGDYSKGCLQGGVALPLDGDGYQVMRPQRRRYYGHPVLVDYVEKLARRVHAEANAPLMIGDLAQPRGGRSNGGHSSHQTGLDVDIWFHHPKVAEKKSLSDKQRKNIPAQSVVDFEGGKIVGRWEKKVRITLRAAAEDERVARIFVNPIIKRQLCEDAKAKDGTWLRKVRPWYGHADHFHVRLHCPPESETCEPQGPVPRGSGCDALDFWFDEEAQERRRKSRKKYQKNVDEGRGWPEACEPLLQ